MIAVLTFGFVAVIAFWAVAEGLTPLDVRGNRSLAAVRAGAWAASIVGVLLTAGAGALAYAGAGRSGALLAGAVVAVAAWHVARWCSRKGWRPW
jgi:hypothetical protein